MACPSTPFVRAHNRTVSVRSPTHCMPTLSSTPVCTRKCSSRHVNGGNPLLGGGLPPRTFVSNLDALCRTCTYGLRHSVASMEPNKPPQTYRAAVPLQREGLAISLQHLGIPTRCLHYEPVYGEAPSITVWAHQHVLCISGWLRLCLARGSAY